MKTTAESVQMPGVSDLRRLIRNVPGFPKPDIVFRDITPLLADPAGFALAVELMAQPFRGKPIDMVVAPEARGLVFGAAVAQALSVGLVPIRKPGKLPAKVRRHEYELEYGTDALEIHEDALSPGQNVLIVDDLLAIGGTLAACCELVRGLGANAYAVVVLIELTACEGRKRLENERVVSILTY